MYCVLLLEEGVLNEFENITVTWVESIDMIVSIGDYIEKWRVSFWTKAFHILFIGKIHFTKINLSL